MVTRAPVVWMIDPDGLKRGQIRYQRLTVIPRFNEVGTWLVQAVATASNVRAAAPGWRIVVDDESGLYGGPMTEATLKFDGRRFQLTLSGVDDMAWLKWSLAWPEPTAPVGTQTVAYDVREGVASTVLMDYLAANRGPLATDATRRIPGMTIAADPEIGGTVTGRARFDEMLTLFQGLAVTGGVGMRMLPSIGATFAFDVYEPPDVAGPARFGLALGNLTDVEWRLTAPTATQVIGGGRGEEEAREFISQTHLVEDDDWGRREAFFDHRAAADDDGGAELAEGTARRLDEAGATQLIDIEPKDTDRLRFGRDYQLGSVVQVDVAFGLGMTAVIREVEITADRSGSDGPARRVKPRVGDIGATWTSRQTLAIRNALSRIAALETRK